MAQALPQAQISYDRFRVVAMANEAMDEVRRNETSTQPNRSRLHWVATTWHYHAHLAVWQFVHLASQLRSFGDP